MKNFSKKEITAFVFGTIFVLGFAWAFGNHKTPTDYGPMASDSTKTKALVCVYTQWTCNQDCADRCAIDAWQEDNIASK